MNGTVRRLSCALLALCLLLTPGCLLGSPTAAIGGAPYGMFIDDIYALQGKRGRIWSDAPFFAVVDLPFAFVLDTALLPISLIMWPLVGMGERDSDRDSDRASDRDGDDHDEGADHHHGDDHDHNDDIPDDHVHGEGPQDHHH